MAKKTSGSAPNISGWLKQIMCNGSLSRSGRLARCIILSIPLDEREKKMGKLISDIAEHYYSDNNDACIRGIGLLTVAFVDESLKRRDYTFINAIHSVRSVSQKNCTDMVRWHMLQSYFRCIGASPQMAKRFCRIMFKDLAEQLTEVLPRGGHGLVAFFEQATPLFVSFIWEAVYAPARPESFPCKLWFNQLVAICGKGDEEIDGWLECIWFLVSMRSDKVNMFPQSDLDTHIANNTFTLTQYVTTKFDPAHPRILIENETFRHFLQFVDTFAQRLDREKAEATEWCNWFKSNLPLIRPVLVTKRKDILQRPVRGVRRNGCDSIDVSTMSIFRYLGITSIAFYPNGSVFPDMDVQFRCKRMNAMMCSVQGSLDQMNLVVPKQLYGIAGDDNHELFHLITEFILTEVLHQLTVKEDGRTKMRIGCSNNGSRTSRRNVPLSWYWPKLPDGSKASQHAIKLSIEETGFAPPEGQTYNSGYDPQSRVEDDNSEVQYAITDELIVQQIMDGT